MKSRLIMGIIIVIYYAYEYYCFFGPIMYVFQNGNK